MKLTFEQTTQDVWDFTKHNLTRHRWLRLMVIFIIAMGLLSVVFSFQGNQSESLLSTILPLVLIVVIWFFILRLIKRRMETGKGKDLFTGKRELELLDTGIRIWTPVSETVYQWSVISGLEQSTNNYFMYMGKNQAIIVPKSAFKNEAEKAAFEQLVNSKIS